MKFSNDRNKLLYCVWRILRSVLTQQDKFAGWYRHKRGFSRSRYVDLFKFLGKFWTCHPECVRMITHINLWKHIVIHACFYSELLLKLHCCSSDIRESWQKTVNKTTLVSGKQRDFSVDLFVGSVLLPSGDLYYVVSINVGSVMAFLLGKA